MADSDKKETVAIERTNGNIASDMILVMTIILVSVLVII